MTSYNTQGAEWRRSQSARYLNGIAASGRRIAALNAELDARRELVRGISYDRLAVSTSPTADAIPDAVARMQETSAAIAAEIEGYSRAVAECHDALDEMGGWEADLLRLRYLAGKTLVEIGRMDAWSHDRKYMSVLHTTALVRFADFIPAPMREPRPRAV